MANKKQAIRMAVVWVATLLYTQHLRTRVYGSEARLGLVQLRAGIAVDVSFPNVPPFLP